MCSCKIETFLSYFQTLYSSRYDQSSGKSSFALDSYLLSVPFFVRLTLNQITLQLSSLSYFLMSPHTSFVIIICDDMKKLHFPSHLSRVESFCLITLSQIHFESFLCLQTRNPLAPRLSPGSFITEKWHRCSKIQPTKVPLLAYIKTPIFHLYENPNFNRAVADKFQSPYCNFQENCVLTSFNL